MPRTGKPTKLAPQIYAYRTSIRVVARAGDAQLERRYPLGTDVKTMQRWQLNTKADLMASLPAPTVKGSIAGDTPLYLATLHGRRRKDDRALLQHWIDSPLADVPRQQITRTMVKAQLATWEAAGASASSLNHRLRALRNLYRELDGDEDPNPTDKIKKRTEPPPQPRGVSYDLIEAIIAYMPDRGRAARGGTQTGVSLGKARARVMAWTGLPPAQVMQLQRVHFNRKARTLAVQPRRKGKGTPAQTIPLLPQAVDALQGFFDAGAEGRFNMSAFYQQWKRAQHALERALRHQVEQAGGDPSTVTVPRIRPYDLRHSFGTEVYRRSRDLLAVRKLMLHAKVTTSERYIEGAVDEAALRAITTWAGPSGAIIPLQKVAEVRRKPQKRAGRSAGADRAVTGRSARNA